MLRRTASACAPVEAIIKTRINQVGRYSVPSRNDLDGLGFKITKIDGEDTTDEELDEMRELEDFIYYCGIPNGEKDRDHFDTFLRKVIRDSLTLDQINFELVKDDKGELLAFYPVDASTIRVATENYTPDDTLDLEKPEDLDEIRYVQIIDGQIVAYFTYDELAFEVRNPRTDVKHQPYGYSEIEVVIREITSFLDSIDYNSRFFRQGGMTKGILNIKEDPAGIGTHGTFTSFKRQWRTQVTGQKGAWKIPVFQLPGEVEFINLEQSKGDMVFETFSTYLINMICAVYQIDPAEINFPNQGGVGGGSSSLFNGDDSKVRQSKDKGLFPLLQFIENFINKHIVSTISDKYAFSFVLEDAENQEKRVAIDRQRVSTFMTVNELREEKGLKPLENGDIILDPYFMQSQQAGGGGGGGFDFSFLDSEEEIETFDENTEELNENIEKSIVFEEFDPEVSKKLAKSNFYRQLEQMRGSNSHDDGVDGNIAECLQSIPGEQL